MSYPLSLIRTLSVAGIVAALWATPPVLHAQSDTDVSEKNRALITELMRVSGGDQVGQIMSQYFVQSFTQAVAANDPNTDPKVFSIIEEEVNALITEEIEEKQVMVDLIAPIYVKHLTDEDLQNTLDFYKTETGKKFIEVMPLITQESMQVGNAWGQSLAPRIQQRVMDRLKAEGLEPK